MAMVVSSVKIGVISVGNLKLLDLLRDCTQVGESTFHIVFSGHETIILGLDFVNHSYSVDGILPFIPVYFLSYHKH